MERRPTMPVEGAEGGGRRSGASRPVLRRRYRLLHSTGEVLIADRAQALARLARLPGAKLFVLEDAASVAR